MDDEEWCEGEVIGDWRVGTQHMLPEYSSCEPHDFFIPAEKYVTYITGPTQHLREPADWCSAGDEPDASRALPGHGGRGALRSSVKQMSHTCRVLIVRTYGMMLFML
jgi:hypothetical protein